MKCDCNNGSVVSGIRESILFSFILDKPSGYEKFCEPETFLYKKVNESFLNTKSFHLEGNKNEKSNFRQEFLTFTLQMIKIWTIEWAFKSLNVILVP